MKFNLFLKFLKEFIMYTSDIDLRTSRIIISNFVACMSESERNKYGFDLMLLAENLEKQVSIDSLQNDLVYERLQNRLSKLKDSEK